MCAGDASFQTPPPPTAGSTPGRPWPARRWWWWAHGTRADKLSGEAQAVARWPAAATCLCGHPQWRFCWGSDPAAAHLTLGWSSAETSGQPTIRFLAMPCLFLSLSDHTTPGPGEERMDHGWRQWHVAMGGPAQSRQPVTPANTLIQCALSDESFFFLKFFVR